MKSVAFIKAGGLAAGGIEKYLQTLAVSLPKDLFRVDFYYTDGFRYTSGWEHPGTDSLRKKYLEDNGINLIKVEIGSCEDLEQGGRWLDTNFNELFDESKYDFIVGASKGTSIYPFSTLPKEKVIDTIHSLGGFRPSKYHRNVLITDAQKDAWVSAGGKNQVVIYPLVAVPKSFDREQERKKIRQELGIADDVVVFGMHQSDRPGLFSPIPLNCYSKMEGMHPDKTFFIMVGGEAGYKEQARQMSIKNITFYPFQGSLEGLHSILSALDVYLHGRYDGEVCSSAIIEAMFHSLPVVSHNSPVNNGHKFQLDECGFFCENEGDYIMSSLVLLEHDIRSAASSKTKKMYNKKFGFDACLRKFIKMLMEPK